MGIRVYERDGLVALASLVAKAGSQTKAAKQLGIKQPYLSDLLNGRRDLSDSVLDKLGLRKAVVSK